jgi:hypothetical protein
MAMQGRMQEEQNIELLLHNHVMFSDTDDLLFLNDLFTWIRSNWSGIPLVLSGHSNGGMMTHRVWCEAPELYSLYERSYGHKIDSLESAGQFILREELARWSPDLP